MSFDGDPTSMFWLAPPEATWSVDLVGALADDPTGRLLRGICSRGLSISQLRMVKAAIRDNVAEGNDLAALRPLRLGLIGSNTLDFLADALPGTAPRFGLRVDVAPVHFNNIATAAFTAPDFEGGVDAIVVMPDTGTFRRPEVLLDHAAHEAAVADALDKIERIVGTLQERHTCPVILATIPMQPDALASMGDRAIPGSYGRFTADLNMRIIDFAASQRHILWDLDQVAATIGYRLWRDPVAMHVAKSPFSIGLAPLVADRLCAVLSSVFGKSRRALVLDLDNTLWGGVIGDDGLGGIVVGQGDAVGEAHLAVQRFALDLRQRGIVLAICSKNEDTIAREPFREHPDMLLREEHIAVFQANWSDKATNLKSIADALALNLDSMVFLDDNPAERARVRQVFPEVAVPELPDDPAYFVACLAAGGYFEAATLGSDDLARADAYQGNARRAEIRRTLGSYEDYLSSLEMRLTVSPFDQVGRPRIVQLINKSNQFNLTTRRRQEPEIIQIEESRDHIGLQIRLSDTFGDNGMICVILLRLEEDHVVIDTWLMSCRVLERGVEQAVLNEIVAIAKAIGVQRVVGEYIPSSRNEMVRNHYARLGFTIVHDEIESGRSLWELDVAGYSGAPVHMAIDRAAVDAHLSARNGTGSGICA